MRTRVSVVALALIAITFVAPAFGGGALAQTAPSRAAGSDYSGLQQIALTEAQIKQYIAAQPDMEAALGDDEPQAGEPPDPKLAAKLDAVAKKYKFASYDEFNQVAGNIALVLDGVDPQAKKYVGAVPLLKQAIEEAKADKKMSDDDRKATLAELNDELKNAAPVTFPGNIDLVIKNYEALAGSEAAQNK